MKIFCAIDLQKYFSATTEQVISQVVLELNKSISNKEPICLIQYSLGSWVRPQQKDIHEKILETIDGYELATVLTKDTDSAAKVIINYLSQFSDTEHTIKICGVNLEACVFKTIEELSAIDSLKVQLLVKCCSGEKHPDSFFSQFSKMKNVSIIV